MFCLICSKYININQRFQVVSCIHFLSTVAAKVKRFYRNTIREHSVLNLDFKTKGCKFNSLPHYKQNCPIGGDLWTKTALIPGREENRC